MLSDWTERCFLNLHPRRPSLGEASRSLSLFDLPPTGKIPDSLAMLGFRERSAAIAGES